MKLIGLIAAVAVLPAASSALAQDAGASPASPPAVAQDASKDLWNDKSTAAIGIGAGTTIGGTASVMVHKFFTPDWGLQASLGFDIASVSGDDGAGMEVLSGTRTSVALGGYAARQLLRMERGGVSGLAGVELGFSTLKVDVGGNSDRKGLDVTVAAGVQAELFLFSRLSLFAQTGLAFRYLGEGSAVAALGFDPGPDTDVSNTQLQLGPTSIVGLFGVTWWL